MNGIVNLNTRVSELLDRMGVPDYTAGYSFLHTAIMLSLIHIFFVYG